MLLPALLCVPVVALCFAAILFLPIVPLDVIAFVDERDSTHARLALRCGCCRFNVTVAGYGCVTHDVTGWIYGWPIPHAGWIAVILPLSCWTGPVTLLIE